MVLIGRASSMEIQQKHIPQLRFPDFFNNGEWKDYSIEEVFDIRNGYTPSKSKTEYWENGTIPWFRMEDIRANGNILSDSIQHITPEAIKGFGLFPACSIIVATSATIGEHALITVESLANQRFTYLSKKKPFENKVDMLYFHYYMFVIDEWCKKNTNTGGFLSVNMSAFRQLRIPLSTLAEQRRIAACLSALDEMLAATNGKLEQLKAYKKGLMQKLFPAKGKKQPELRFKEFVKDGEWEVKKLGEVVDVFQGYGFPERMQGKTRGKYPFIKVSDISMTVNNGGKYIDVANNYVDEEDLPILGATPFPIGTIVFAKIGEAIRLNRRVILSKPSLIDNNVGGVKAKDGLSNDDFVFYIMSMIDLVKYAGGVVPAVKKTAIENIEVLMPPTLDEQQKIAEVLTSIDKTIMQKTKKTSLLKIYKKGLMQRMFPIKNNN